MTALVALFVSLALFVQEADARRLGGGKSFGRQSGVMRQQAAPPQKAQDAAAKPAQPAAQPPSPGSRWFGPLAGIAAGLGIAALLSHFGLTGAFASALGSLLVIGLLAFAALCIWRMLRGSSRAAQENESRLQPAFEVPSAANARFDGETNVYGAPLPGATASTQALSATIPEGFDVQGFLRSAKVSFNRLQAAWDVKDLDDIRRFTTPEAFAEIKMQRDEAAGAIDRTEIDDLDARLLGVETVAGESLASVRFTGTIRENGGNARAFEEVWNFVNAQETRGNWLLAGIQQLH